jgi:hypothetical protein
MNRLSYPEGSGGQPLTVFRGLDYRYLIIYTNPRFCEMVGYKWVK